MDEPRRNHETLMKLRMKFRALLIAAVVLAVAAFYLQSQSRPPSSPAVDSNGTRPSSGQPVEPTRENDVPAAVERNPTAPGIVATAAEPAEAPTLCPYLPALPGIEDLRVSSCEGGRLGRLLAREEIDAGWAAVVAGRIRAQVAANDQGRQFDRVEIVCRRTACGLLLILPEDQRGEFVPTELSRVMIETIANETGFGNTLVVHTHTDDGLPVTLGLIEHAKGREDDWPPAPDPKRIEALPGVIGYAVAGDNSLPTRDFPMAPELLAAEAVDPSWAPVMEGRIIGVIASIGLPVQQMHVVCRATRCGVVLDFPEGTNRQDMLRAMQPLTTRVRMELKLKYCPLNVNPYPSTALFAALYFEAGEDSGCSLDL